MATNNPPDDKSAIPSTVVIGVPNQKALHRVIKKLELNNITYESFHEPDWDLGLTSVATVPLSESQRSILKDYSIWRESNNAQLHIN